MFLVNTTFVIKMTKRWEVAMERRQKTFTDRFLPSSSDDSSEDSEDSEDDSSELELSVAKKRLHV